MHVVEPTAVQSSALQMLMPRTPSQVALGPPPRHAVIRWPTGAGKSIAYALPLIARLDTNNLGDGLQALVIVPTRELALQTLHLLAALTGQGKSNKKGHYIKTMSLLGDVTPRMKNELAHQPPDIAVGTAHTVAHLLERGHLPLAENPRERFLILDEVTTLLADSAHSSWALQALRASDDGRNARGFRGLGIVRAKGVHPSEREEAAAAGLSGGKSVWASANLWMVSAYVPRQAVQDCVDAVRHGLKPLPERPYIVQPDYMMPREVRHVAVMQPKANLGPLCAILVTPKHLLKSSPEAESESTTSMDGADGIIEGGAGLISDASAASAASAASDVLGAAGAGAGSHSDGLAATADDANAATEHESADQVLTDSDDDDGGTADASSLAASTLMGSARAAIVFVRSGRDAERLQKSMRNKRISSAAIHGSDGDGAFKKQLDELKALGRRDRVGAEVRAKLGLGRREEESDIEKALQRRRLGGHRERQRILDGFAAGRVKVLAATEMLAVGVDIRGATHVVNADVPSDAASYLHRAGRVGRTGGASGTVVSLPRDERELQKLHDYASELGFVLEVEEAPPLKVSTQWEIERKARKDARMRGETTLWEQTHERMQSRVAQELNRKLKKVLKNFEKDQRRRARRAAEPREAQMESAPGCGSAAAGSS